MKSIDQVSKRKRGQIYFLAKKGEIYAKAGEIDCVRAVVPHSAGSSLSQKEVLDAIFRSLDN